MWRSLSTERDSTYLRLSEFRYISGKNDIVFIVAEDPSGATDCTTHGIKQSL